LCAIVTLEDEILQLKNYTHLNEDYQFPELETEQTDNLRLYVTKNGEKYPSVTTVLGWHTRKGIMEWRKRVGEEAANKISRQASARGTRFHYHCEDYLNNKEPTLEGPGEKSMFNSILPLLHRIDNIHFQEKAMSSKHLQTAGRVDCIAEFDGRLSIIDFKTANKPKQAEYIDNYFMQGAAYCVMFEENTRIPIDQVVILVAVEGDEPQVFVVKRDDYIGQYIGVRNAYREATGY
jgi:ATP-dependent exoDNAse (exonuclease V) beta subunit